MKSPVLITAALLCASVFARADVEVTMAKLRAIGFLPQDKADLRPEEKLDLKRRNPFAERKKVVVDKPTESVETEESKLRGFFSKQKVSGIFKMDGKTSVSIGRLTLEAGQVIPTIIPDQTQRLRVLKVDDNMVEIGWVEETGFDNTSVPRKIRLKIDLKPRVDSLIVSEDSLGENARMFSTDEKGKVVIPQRNMVPNPSDIVDSLPPGSDMNPESALSAQEQADLAAVENAAGPPPPPVPQPDTVPDALPATDTPPPPEDTEDAVQPDPDAAAAPDSAPAGPPSQ